MLKALPILGALGLIACSDATVWEYTAWQSPDEVDPAVAFAPDPAVMAIPASWAKGCDPMASFNEYADCLAGERYWTLPEAERSKACARKRLQWGWPLEQTADCFPKGSVMYLKLGGPRA